MVNGKHLKHCLVPADSGNSDAFLIIMEAKELRIGNYVKIYNLKYFEKIKDIPLVVTSISENLDYYSISLEHIENEKDTYYERYSQKNEYIKPIPLTEEWLLKFWFCKIGFNYSFYTGKDGIEFIIWTKHYEFQPIGLYFRFGDFDIELKYVHQLQNLYFALTGEELTIN